MALLVHGGVPGGPLSDLVGLLDPSALYNVIAQVCVTVVGGYVRPISWQVLTSTKQILVSHDAQSNLPVYRTAVNGNARLHKNKQNLPRDENNANPRLWPCVVTQVRM